MTLEITEGRDYFTANQRKARQMAYDAANKLTADNNTAVAQLDALKRVVAFAAKNSGGCYDRAEVMRRSVIGDMIVKLEKSIRNYGEKAFGLSDKQMAYAIDDTVKLVA